jgi:hypothetical protein
MWMVGTRAPTAMRRNGCRTDLQAPRKERALVWRDQHHLPAAHRRDTNPGAALNAPSGTLPAGLGGPVTGHAVTVGSGDRHAQAVRGGRRWEVRWVPAEVAQQSLGGECSRGQRGQEERGFLGAVVARALEEEEEQG